MEDVTRREWWSARTTNEKLAIGIGGIAFLMSLVVAAAWVLWPRYEPLFNELTPQEMTEVANQLAQYDVRYRMDEDAGRILVAKSDIRKARATVLEHGLPIGKPLGFELFNDVEFGMTDFTQRINYQRALEGELTRTITSLDEVQHARLHLVLPESGLFSKESGGAKASIALALKPGRQLSQRQVQGIQRLLSSSVPGLSEDRVSILDQNGVSLVVKDQRDPHLFEVGRRLEAKQRYEAYFSAKARDVLEPVMGGRPANVVVNVDIDHDLRRRVRLESLPVGKGITGTVRRLRSQRQPSDADPTESSDSADGIDQMLMAVNATTEVEYEAGKQEETTEVASGAVDRLTVAITIPGDPNEALREALVLAVNHAVGVRAERGDSVSVVFIPLLNTVDRASDQAEPAEIRGSNFPAMLVKPWQLPALLAVLVMMGVLIGTWISGRSRHPKSLAKKDRDALLKELRTWMSAADGGPRS